MNKRWLMAVPMLALFAGGAVAVAAEPDISLTCTPDDEGYRSYFVRIYVADRKIEIDGISRAITEVRSDRIVSEEFRTVDQTTSNSFRKLWTIYRNTLAFEIASTALTGNVNYISGTCERGSAQF